MRFSGRQTGAALYEGTTTLRTWHETLALAAGRGSHTSISLFRKPRVSRHWAALVEPTART